MKTRLHILSALLILLLLAGASLRTTHAEVETTFNVNTFGDELNTDGDCSLREAVRAANTNTAVSGCPAGSATGADIINLPAGTYTLSILGQTADESAGDLDIRGLTRFIAASPGGVVIRGGSGWNDRIFEVFPDVTVLMIGVTISGGRAETLNPSVSTGGGILVRGAMTLLQSTVDGNVALDGGGITVATGALVTLNESTVSNNTARSLNNLGGGGILSSGRLFLNNSTISGNKANLSGGGLLVRGDRTTLSSVTLANNIADVDNNNSGEGDAFRQAGGTLISKNSIANTSCNGGFTSQGHNLFQTVCGGGSPHPTDIFGNDGNPNLGPLADNGGPTRTHAIRPPSRAIDGGDPAGCGNSAGVLLPADQRGEPRPVDGNHDGVAVCDVGAFEFAPPPPVTFTVDDTSDATDARPGDGLCQTLNTNKCTLRAAIQEANARGSADTIALPEGNHLLGLRVAAGGEDSAQGDLDIAANLRIEGAGRNLTFINGNRQAVSDNILELKASAVVTISGVTLENGESAIVNAGRLTLENARVRNNLCDNQQAGGGASIANSGRLVLTNVIASGNDGSFGQCAASVLVNGLSATATISRSIFQNNSGAHQVNGPNLTIDRTTISGSTLGNGDFSGGILAQGALTLTNSTISNNVGSGLHVATRSPNEVVSLVNTTISGNSGVREGAGIFHERGTLSLNNVTITNNRTQPGFNNNDRGGGMVVNSAATIKNSIIAGNASTTGPDCAGTFTSQGHNLIGNTAGCTITGDTTGNVTGQSARLAPLRLNGGPTRTHALLDGSPAIDAGSPAAPGSGVACAARDQRGTTRPRDGNGDGRARCDIGAFERASVGESILLPSTGASMPGVKRTFALTWTHPHEWRDLESLDLRFRDGDQVVLWLRFSESRDEEGADTSTFSLLDADGEVIGSGRPGDDAVLETELGRFYLAESRFAADGPTDPSVVVEYTLSFGEALMGRTLDVELLASDDTGDVQGADLAGRWTVGQNRVALPFVIR